MDLTKMTFFKMAKHRLDHAAQRQTVLAQNVANANTPNYKPKDLKPLDFRKELGRANQLSRQVRPTQTNPMHLKGTLPERPSYDTTVPVRTFEESPDGNKVVLEEQMRKVSTARGDYTLAINLFRKNVQMLRTALGKK